MEIGASPRSDPPEGVWRGDSKHCPFCIELLGPGKLHLCPTQCCYVRGFEGDEEVLCPYDGIPFRTTLGHICMELIKRTEPAQ